MRIFSVIFFICSLSLIYIKTQATPPPPSDTAWVYVYGGKQHDYARQIISCSDSGYLVIGTTSSFGVAATDLYIIKTDKNCDRQWSNIYGSAEIEWGYGAKETPDKG